MSFEFTFAEAIREAFKLRLALEGVTGGGKTWTALLVATLLLGGTLRDRSMVKRIAVIDSERGSAKKYASGQPFYFSNLELKSYEPEAYVAAIKAAERQGFEFIIIDSLSHEWIGTGGALEQVDRSAKRGNTFAAWGLVTPRHNAVIDAIMDSTCHIAATMRQKMGHEQSEENGKKIVKKLGLQAEQRGGIEYEFDVVGELDTDNTMTVDKTRCSELKGKRFLKPGREFVEILQKWLITEPAPAKAPVAEKPAERRREEPRQAQGLVSGDTARDAKPAPVVAPVVAPETPSPQRDLSTPFVDTRAGDASTEIPFDVEAMREAPRQPVADPWADVRRDALTFVSGAPFVAVLASSIDDIEKLPCFPIEYLNEVRRAAMRRMIVVATTTRELAEASKLATRTVAPTEWHDETRGLYSAKRKALPAAPAGAVAS